MSSSVSSNIPPSGYKYASDWEIPTVFNGDSEQQSIYPVKLPAVFVKQIDKNSESNTSSGGKVSVKDLKERFYNQSGYRRFPSAVFHKYWGGRELEDNMILSEEEAMHVEYFISNTLHLVLRLRGSGIFFPFSSLKDAYYSSFSDKAPEWRLVAKGLNLYGTCQTDLCKAFGKEVIINKGIGHIENIAKHLRTSECPLCHKAVKDVKSMSLYCCKYKIEGHMLRPEDQPVSFEGSADREDGNLKFSSETADWSYLSVTTSPLAQKSNSSLKAEEEGGCIIV